MDAQHHAFVAELRTTPKTRSVTEGREYLSQARDCQVEGIEWDEATGSAIYAYGNYRDNRILM